MDPLPWWKDGVIYQLLVPSFLDTNGDGLGDLGGVRERLDYLEWLGIRSIWLSPIYPSPMADLGYDIADYCSVNRRFGSLEQFDELIQESHRRGIKIILDWAPNHTSDEHPWFVDSRSSREASKRDWYFWRDAKPDRSPPNNWISVFGGTVWQWDEPTQQFYLHSFLDKQPDLNLRNPEVRQALFGTLRFWLDRGIDGFRVDATCWLMKDEQLRDNPPNPDFVEGDGPDSKLLGEHSRNQPGLHEFLAEMRGVLDGYDDRMLAGELYQPLETLVQFYGTERPELHLPLNLKPAWTPWDPQELGRLIEQYEQLVPPHGWPTWTISTHDCPRIAARCQGEQARLAAMLLLTLRGTPTLYYGEEIGMRGVPIPPEQARDPQGRRTGRNRDPERTPMQWDNRLHAGFSTREPWLPIGDDFQTANVATQRADPRSILTLYRRLIAVRCEEPALLLGQHRQIVRQKPLLAYLRSTDDRQLFVALNLGAEEQTCELDERRNGRIALSTFLDRQDEEVHNSVRLRGDEGVIVALDS